MDGVVEPVCCLLVLGIVKASLEILGIGIGVKKVVLLRSGAGAGGVWGLECARKECT